ncbi:MAG: acetyl-CoA C-acyltransferase FadI [Myxococcales bacterium]|nr:acetyl-CoA C-acyltransferase FadI [Myxococcales bacterium]
MVRAVAPVSGLPRVAIVAGLRTPFAKMGSAYKQLSALELGTMVVHELLERAALPAKELDALVYGQVVPSLVGPNIAREVSLALPLPRAIDAFSVSRACATSTQATATAAQMIQTGQAQVVVTGGADSASDVPIALRKPLAEALISASQAKKPLDKLKAFADVHAKDLLPDPPALVELSTGLSMGQAAEKMAKENGIRRADQDAFAHRSHSRAAQAWRDGIFAEEVMTARVPPSYEAYAQDNLTRMDSTVEGYQRLKPVFDRKWGTVTAGNSSPLTDGASALLLMREDVAKALGYPVLAYIRSYAFAALDPSEQLLMGPAYATPRALDAAGVKLSDMSVIDLHEAFAAQMLSNLQAFASKAWAKEKLGRAEAIGEVPDDKLNLYGGSIALGHPFAATGARQINTVARELKRRGGGLGLIAQCAAGGLGAAMILESEG